MLLRGLDSCKPHGLVSSRHCTAVAISTVTEAQSDLWLPLLAPLAAQCGRDVNEGRTSGPSGSCGPNWLWHLWHEADSRGLRQGTTRAVEGRATSGNVGAFGGTHLRVPAGRRKPHEEPTHSIAMCFLSFPTLKGRLGSPPRGMHASIHLCIRWGHRGDSAVNGIVLLVGASPFIHPDVLP